MATVSKRGSDDLWLDYLSAPNSAGAAEALAAFKAAEEEERRNPAPARRVLPAPHLPSPQVPELGEGEFLDRKSFLRAVLYDTETRVLGVRFKSGSTYRYFNVPPHVYRDFLASRTKTKFFRERVRLCFRYQRVQDADRDAAGPRGKRP